jgi:class 3 adenylate cyclase/predicted ATPase
LAATCPKCSAEVTPGDSFCGNCGTQVGTAAAAHPASTETPSGSDAEKRFVSVLFADIVAYTTFSEGRDPDEVRDLLTVYFDRARAIIEKFGGFVDKFIGDAVMGVWGAEATREDDCERSVRAALELVSMVAALGEEQGHEGLRLRAGVNSGSTSVGPGGNDKGLIVGDLVNAAARLQSVAEPGTVFVGGATHDVTARSIVYESRGNLEVKGKTEPVEAWKAIRPAGRVGREVSGRELPFTGRDREMRLLKDMLEATSAEQRARLVSITGEAGIGKSRLGREFMNHVDGFSETVFWHQGRSPSYGDGLPMWAVGEMIRQRAGIAEDEEPSRALTRLRTCLAEYVPDDQDRQWIEGWLAGLLGLGDMPAGAGSELHSAIRTFFQNIATQGTTVLVFEDLHWADASTVEFLGELVDRSTRSPILVVTLARPELLGRFPGFGSAQRSSMSVSLAPLVDADMTAMLTEHLPGVEPGVIAHIVGRASGFPLYAAEIVRMLTNEGSLVQVDSGWEFHGTAENLAVPDTLQAVIEARLDRLEPELRSVLQNASVLGLTCTAAGLAAVGHSENLGADLRQLVQLELLEVEDDPRSPERGQYRFVQGVIQEIAYGRLHRADRRDRHLAAAEYFQTFDDPELAGVVSTHYQKAFDASPQGEQRDALQRRAIEALVTAAERAASLHSDIQAMDLYDQAMAFTTDKVQQATWLLRAAASATNDGAFERGIAYLDQANHAFREAGDQNGLRRAATMRSYLYNSAFSSPSAVAAIEPFYLGLEDITDDVTLGVAAETARGYALIDRTEEALTVADRALPAANRLGRTDLTAELLVTRATALAFAGRGIEGLAGLRGALEISEQEGLLNTAIRSINNLVSVMAGYSFAAAHALHPRFLELTERVGGSDWIVRAKLNMSDAAWGRGAWDELLDWADQMEALATDPLWADIIASMRASAETFRGVDGARARWLAIVDKLDSDDPQTHANMEHLRSLAAMIAGDWRAAYNHGLAAAEMDWSALPTAARAAVRLGDVSLLDPVEALIDLCAHGPARTALHAMCAATRQAMLGNTTSAAQGFTTLLGLMSGVATDQILAQVKLGFAEAAGLDNPAAAQAAREVADWIEATGTYGLLALSTVLDTPAAAAEAG